MIHDFVFDLDPGEVQWRSVGPTPAFVAHLTPSLLADDTFLRDLDQLRARMGQPVLAESRTRATQIAELGRVARRIGARLTDALLSAEARTAVCKRLAETERGVPRLTLRIAGGPNGDAVLALPWELLMPEAGRFGLEEARLDLVRDAMRPDVPELDAPTGPFSVAVTIAAPDDQTALRYEDEAYRLLKVLAPLGQLAHFAELGEVDDLVELIRSTNATMVHFSGHGLPGELIFEDEFGMSRRISVETLMSRLRLPRSSDATHHALPRLFFLASCHGASAIAAAPRVDREADRGAGLSTAATLHREGFTGVLGYFGPIGDAVGTAAEIALYGALSAGATILQAVRRARPALAQEHGQADERYDCPLGWAQLAVFLRGADCPLTSRPRSADIGIQPPARLGREKIEICGLPVLAHGFIGRRARQHEVRRRYRAGQRLFVLQGLGGLGKTALASQLLCNVFTSRLQDQLILCAREATDIDELRRQAEIHGEIHALPDWQGQVKELRRDRPDPVEGFEKTVLALRRHCPGLVIYADNMEALQIGPTGEDPGLPGAIGAWRPGVARWWAIMESLSNDGVILASTRYAWADLPPGALISLDRMSRADLWRMLDTLPTLARLPWSVRRTIANTVDGRPRTLELLEGYLRQADGDPARDLEKAWTEDFAPMLANHGSELTEDLLLPQLWRHLSAGARDHAVAAVVLQQPAPLRVLDVLGPATEELLRAGLLTRHRDLTALSTTGAHQLVWEDRWSMHTLVRQFVRSLENLVDLRRARGSAASEYAAMIAENGAQVPDYFEAIRLHLANKDGASAWPLARALVRWLRVWGRYVTAVEVLEQVPEADLAADDRLELVVQRAHVRELAGITSLVVEPELLADVANAGSPATKAVGLAEMAGVLVHQANYALAERILRQALDIHERELSREHPDYGGALYMFGVVALRQGNHLEAEHRVRQALAVCESVRGHEHPDYGNFLFELAQVLSAQSKYAEAEHTLRAALAVHERTLGRRHPGYGSDLVSLATLLSLQGQHAHAEPILHEALSIIEEALGREHPDRAAALYELANVLSLQGKYAEAERALRKSLYIHEKTRGTEHPSYGASLHQIACLLSMQGKYLEAEQPIRASLALKARTIGRGHPDYAASLNALANVLSGLGNHSEAELAIRESLAIHERVLGRDHPDCGASLHQLALALSEQKKHAEAERHLRDALDIRERAFGPDHPTLCPTLTTLALAMISQGRPYDAIAPLERAALLGHSHLGEDHSDTRKICKYLELARHLSGLSSPPHAPSGAGGTVGTETVSEYTDPSGAKGYIVQAYDAASATYVMIDALLTDVRWIMAGIPLLPGKGTPVFAYLTMRLMQNFGISAGGLRRLVVRGNHHVESVLQLALRERTGAPLDAAVRETRAYLSAETPMIQSSHIVSRVRVHGGRRDTLASLLDWHVHGGSQRRRAIARDRSAEHDALLARYAMHPRDVVLFDYEVHVDLLPR